MDTIDCIKTRRSIRKFLDKEVSEELIDELIDCARHAPFGGPPIPECQICEYIVIRNKETKKALTLGYEESKFISEAPVLIAVCVDTKKDPEYRDYDIAASLAAENILLAAHFLGLGAVFTTTYTNHIEQKHKEDRKKMYDILDLPEHIRLVTIIAVGWPDPTEKMEEKKLRGIKEIAHFEKW